MWMRKGPSSINLFSQERTSTQTVVLVAFGVHGVYTLCVRVKYPGTQDAGWSLKLIIFIVGGH